MGTHGERGGRCDDRGRSEPFVRSFAYSREQRDVEDRMTGHVEKILSSLQGQSNETQMYFSSRLLSLPSARPEEREKKRSPNERTRYMIYPELRQRVLTTSK